MIQVFLGYRNVIGHLIDVEYDDGRHDIFKPEVAQWCRDNLSGPAMPYYHMWYETDEDGRERGKGRIEFEFANLDDAALFKLFWVGG